MAWGKVARLSGFVLLPVESISQSVSLLVSAWLHFFPPSHSDIDCLKQPWNI